MIPRSQWETALRLAARHRHAWADWATGHDARRAAANAAEKAAYQAAVRAGDGEDEAWAAGVLASAAALEAPLVPVDIPDSWGAACDAHCASDEAHGFKHALPPVRPYWVHTTGTGRVAWVVDPDGTVHIDVARPGGVAIRCVVGPAPARAVTLSTTGLPYGERHIDALYECVVVLRPWDVGFTESLRAARGYDDIWGEP